MVDVTKWLFDWFDFTQACHSLLIVENFPMSRCTRALLNQHICNMFFLLLIWNRKLEKSNESHVKSKFETPKLIFNKVMLYSNYLHKIMASVDTPKKKCLDIQVLSLSLLKMNFLFNDSHTTTRFFLLSVEFSDNTWLLILHELRFVSEQKKKWATYA